MEMEQFVYTEVLLKTVINFVNHNHDCILFKKKLAEILYIYQSKIE